MPLKEARPVSPGPALTTSTDIVPLFETIDDLRRVLRAIAPITEIARPSIGSRPASRTASDRIEDRRAVPWVFGWTQCRLSLPAWFGVGTAFHELVTRARELTIDAIASGLRKQQAEVELRRPSPTGVDPIPNVDVMAAPLPAQSDELVDACGDDPSGLCRWIYERWGNADVATFVDWVVDRPLRIVLIVLAALIVTRIVRRAVRRFAEHLTSEATKNRLQRVGRGRAGRLLVDETIAARARARTQTIASVLTSSLTALVGTIAGLLVVGEVGVNLAPLIAGAGVAGIAVGFGAQAIVRDFLSGIFMIVEDQFGVGDVVDVGEVVGTVERVSLRTTVLRDVHGAVWHVPNGEIRRVGNKSQLWSRAVLDVEVAYQTDLDLAQGVLQRVADEVWNDEEFTAGAIIEPPEVWGVESLTPNGVTLRLVVKTDPADQWGVARELRLRIKRAFDEAGIEIPAPQQTIYRASTPRVTHHPDPSTIPVAPIRRPGVTELIPDSPGPNR